MSDRQRQSDGARAVSVAAAVSVVWLVAMGALVIVLGADAGPLLAIAVAVALPLALIWIAALLARHAAAMRNEADRLSRAADVLREASAKAVRERDQVQARRVPTRPEPAVAEKAATVPTVRTKVGPAPAAAPVSPPAPSVAVPEAARTEPRQVDLPLAMDTQGPEVALADLIRALDFPESAADEDGFRALRLALRDPRTRRLVQASQDILTLLSEDSIYMDDLAPDHARPELWRRFASGERGPELGSIGNVHDRSCLALSAARMRADPVFRDAAHHFLRLFDQALAQLAPHASDAELESFANTRTARAFMLVGRVAGIFE